MPARDWLVAHAPLSALGLIAAQVAPAPRLETAPGWSFTSGDLDTSPRTEFRRKLWRRFANEQVACPVIVPWHAGTRLRVYLGNDMSKLIFVDGLFEPNEFVFLARFLEPGMTFVDVGANDGAYTIFAASRVTAQGRVVAIEASSREFERLSANLALNELANTTAIRVAAGDATGTTSLAIAEYGHEGQNTVGTVVVNPKVATTGLEEVELRQLDDILAQAEVEKVDFIKIDVEGSEPRVLAGALDTLARHQPVLQLELESDWLIRQGSNREAVFEILHAAGYSAWVFDHESGRLRNHEPGESVHGNVIAAPRGRRPPAFRADR